MTRVFDYRAFGLAVIIAFSITFFLGIFYNPPIKIAKYTGSSWYYVNRGYPIAWAGVSKNGMVVDFPVVKAPLLTNERYGDIYEKVIDLRIFIPLFAVLLIPGYAISRIISKAVKENRRLLVFQVICYAVFTLAAIYSYFFWFPRI